MKNLNKELYKEVEKISLKEIFPDHNFPPGFDYAIIDEENNFLNFCSKKYNLVPNKLIFEPIEEELKMWFNFNKKIKIINGSKFYVDYILKEKFKTPSINDVFPKISVFNSYDGTIKFKKEFGYHKLICSNSLTSPTCMMDKSVSKHYANASNEFDTGSTYEFVGTFIEHTKTFLNKCEVDMKVFEIMNKTKSNVKELERISKIAKFSKIMLRMAKKRYEAEVSDGIVYVNENEERIIHDGSSETLFTVYNALNYAIYNTQPKELPEKKLEKDKRLLKLFYNKKD